MNQTQIKAEMNAVIAQAQKDWDATAPAPVADYLKTMEAIEARMSAIDKAAGPGLAVGRVVRFAVADGHAVYFVESFNSRSVTLCHIPLGDAWHFQGLDDKGRIARSVIEKRLAFCERLDSLLHA